MSLQMLSIKLTVDEAKALSAVKLEEVVDKDKIKRLIDSEQEIPKVSHIQYIAVAKALNQLNV